MPTLTMVETMVGTLRFATLRRAVAGEAGVARVLEIFRNEIDRAMALCGVTRIADIGPDLIHRPRR